VTLVIQGSKRTAELVEYENGHTCSDLILRLPRDSIIFMGGLLFVRNHPYIGVGDTDAVMDILQEIRGMEARIFVPGHGPVGGKDDLQVLIYYVEICQDITKRMVSDGQGEEALDEIAVPKPFDSWQQAGFFRSNLRFLYKRMLHEQ
jgi:cyclase